MVFLLPVITGLLLYASFPLVDQGWLAWAAFVPLAAFLLSPGGVRRGFAGGFLAGFTQLFASMAWMPAVLSHYGGLPAAVAWLAYLLLVLVLACFPATACAAAKYLIRRGGDAFILVFPAIWVLLEYAQSLIPFGGLPWLTAGYSQSRYTGIIQISDLTGVYGVSFLLAWSGVAAAWVLHKRGRGLAAWLPALAAIGMIAGSLIYGRSALRQWEAPAPRFRAALLQANLSFDDPSNVLLDKFRNGYVRMAGKLSASGADLLVLPESPSPVFFETDAPYRQNMEQLAGRFRFGIIFNNVRRLESAGESKYFNSAYFLDRSAVLQGVYDKIHLVPFGEYIPFENIFSFIEVISKDVGFFSPGEGYKLIGLDGHPANAIICFEAVFPGLVRQFVQNGSELIVNLTNDAWYGDTAAPYQHFAIARFRAIENRRYFLRAANSGISAVISPSGKIESSTGILREAVCEASFDFIGTRTIYTRYGDVFVLLCAIISCGSAASAGLRGTRKRSY